MQEPNKTITSWAANPADSLWGPAGDSDVDSVGDLAAELTEDLLGVNPGDDLTEEILLKRSYRRDPAEEIVRKAS